MQSTHNNFIEEYLNQVSVDDCNAIISWFESNKSLQTDGYSFGGGKKSKDISIDSYSDIQVNKIILQSLQNSVSEYKKKYTYLNDIPEWSMYWMYNIQKYLPGEGYPQTHYEWSMQCPNRMLVWTLYLNDVTDDGQTYFPYQNYYIESKTGKIVLFPTDWTHMHHGIISKTQTKYIATGWFTYIDHGVYRVA